MIDELMEIQKKIDEAKTKVAQNQGKRDAIISALKKDFQIETDEQIKKKITELEERIEKSEASIKARLEEIKRTIA